jgi:hypothetical protein
MSAFGKSWAALLTLAGDSWEQGELSIAKTIGVD